MADVEQPLFDPTLKKKKKKSTKTRFDLEDGNDTDASKSPDPETATGESAAPTGDGPVDEVTDLMAELGKKKKKKKQSSKLSEFEQQLQEAGVEGVGKDSEDASGDVSAPTVTLNSSGEPDFTYDELLTRFFSILRENNPDLAGDRAGVKYKIPPPQVSRDGNKKSLFSNVKEISERMQRPTDHVIQFLFAELGTSGSVDGSNRLVIKGRFQQKQIETVLRRYIIEYVTCKTCKSVNTKLTKENRLYFLDCKSCGSRRSVSSIKSGYQAILRRERKR